jgi:hypothetical protein
LIHSKHSNWNDSKRHWSTFYGNDCISDSKLRSARKSFTEMIAFPILKYNNHNTVTLCGNDCISDFQWLLCTYMIRFQFLITFCCYFQIRLSWHYYAYFRIFALIFYVFIPETIPLYFMANHLNIYKQNQCFSTHKPTCISKVVSKYEVSLIKGFVFYRCNQQSPKLLNKGYDISNRHMKKNIHQKCLND